jgi:hypothetical protein
MFSKKLVSGLIAILLSLNFATYAIEGGADDLNLAHNSNETSNEYLDSNVNKSCSCDASSCVDVDLEAIIQNVLREYFSPENSKSFENTDSIKNCECKMEKNEDSGCTKICLCKKHLQVLETWKDIISKSDIDAKKNKGNKVVIDGSSNSCQNSNCTDKDFENIMLGFLCKYFFVDSNKSLEDGDFSKSCGCKIWKNKDCGFVEIYLCKEHFKILETESRKMLNLGAETGIDVDNKIITDACGCSMTIENGDCVEMYFCEEHSRSLEGLCASDSDTNKVASNETISSVGLEDVRLEDIDYWAN